MILSEYPEEKKLNKNIQRPRYLGQYQVYQFACNESPRKIRERERERDRNF